MIGYSQHCDSIFCDSKYIKSRICIESWSCTIKWNSGINTTILEMKTSRGIFYLVIINLFEFLYRILQQLVLKHNDWQ